MPVTAEGYCIDYDRYLGAKKILDAKLYAGKTKTFSQMNAERMTTILKTQKAPFVFERIAAQKSGQAPANPLAKPVDPERMKVFNESRAVMLESAAAANEKGFLVVEGSNGGFSLQKSVSSFPDTGAKGIQNSKGVQAAQNVSVTARFKALLVPVCSAHRSGAYQCAPSSRK